MPEQRNQASFAERLDRLFRAVHPRGRGEYSYEEVANAIRGTGVTISHTYIWQLRKGVRDNPTKRHLEALARFFGVPPTYFLDEDTSGVDDQLELLVALRDNSVRSVALRAAGLSEASLTAIMGMIEHARTIEGLPPASETA
ncbi:helix-turn-helix transcriptional regulator [Actinophytocola sp.]|uniref:helix-turn-helix domain-containing protein n=1 Tax=Actinophytocola sp. TaxID=1872138 RepID=UPI002D7E56D5|nr:helix-turn-helix transcriptional regulator [Actinophytocola sp.]HET9141841.1 helix-turn-helix transcriptional regulator [Actinophytocola sp.]